MIYSEKEYKLLLEENKKLNKENELKNKENKLLKKQNKEKDETIHDLDKNNYKEKYNTTLFHYNSFDVRIDILIVFCYFLLFIYLEFVSYY